MRRAGSLEKWTKGRDVIRWADRAGAQRVPFNVTSVDTWMFCLPGQILVLRVL